MADPSEQDNESVVLQNEGIAPIAGEPSVS